MPRIIKKDLEALQLTFNQAVLLFIKIICTLQSIAGKR